jgi:hypothetical protein
MKRIITYLILGLIPFSLMAEWYPVNNGSKDKTAPSVQILSDDTNSTVIKIDISGFEMKEFYSDSVLYQSIDLLSDVSTSQPGYPGLPYISKILGVPDMAGISYEILETGPQQTFYNINLPPCQESWYEGQTEPAFKKNEIAYSSSDIFPNEMASLSTPSIFRDFRIVRVSIYPVRYIASKKELQVTSSITVKIKYNSEKVVNPKTTKTKSIAPSFAKIYESFIINYKSAIDNLYYGDENGRDVMLCIMPDSYVSTFQPYADWKRQSGIDVHITKFSDIGASSSNATIIKNHITDAYHNWEFPPTYVLLVGDDGIFPKETVTYDYSFPSEDYFVEIDGNDFFPEMMIGRFPVQSTYDLQVLINKAMNYEKTPYTASTDWFKKGICCSNNEYASQIETKRFAASVMLQDGNFTSVDTLMSDAGCTYGLNDVIQSISNGRSFLNYRGEGWSEGWWANCYPFSVSDVSSLNNGKKLTFVTSIGCGVAMFDASGGNCFGEEWLKLGTPTSPRGAVAFIGASSNTHTQYDNKIDKGIYVGMFREGLETPGQALLRGKLYMYNVYGSSDPWVEYHYRVFCILGDPSVHIWKEIPLAINVNHPDSVPIGYSQSEITVTYSSTGLPVDSAQVTIVSDSVFASAYTNQIGKVILGITPETLDSLIITVRGGDVIPYQGKIGVYQSSVHVGPLGPPNITGLDGNFDSLMSPNEHFNLSFTLKNWGTQTANNTQATITSLDTNMQVITTTPVGYGNIASGNYVLGSPFEIYINPNAAIDALMKLKLHVTSGSYSWDYLYYHTIVGCELEYKSCTVIDTNELYPNSAADPGETVKLFLSVKNTGVDIAPNVQGILRSNDSYITIPDSIGTFGTIPTNSTGINTTNYYEVSISSSCPNDYDADFTLILSTQGGTYNYTKTVTFSLPIGASDSLDPTGPDAYGYYAYGSDDSLYDQAPVYSWKCINNLGTEINMPASEYTETVNIPFTFKYYGAFFNQVRISTDGWIAFGSGSETSYSNTSLPTADGITSMTAIFWDDLWADAFASTQKLFYWNDAANHRFIIEWDSLAPWGETSSPDYENFEIFLNDPAYYTNPPTGDGEIIFQYKKVRITNSCTVGIENNNDDGALQYVCNNSYQNTASVIKDNFAIKLTTEPPTLKNPVSVPEVSGNLNEFGLEKVFPNPFDQNTVINYSIQEQGSISLKIYDISGHLIKVLYEGTQQGGNYSIVWDGRNDSGDQLSAGLYFVKLISTDFSQTMKLCRLRSSQQ